MCNTSLPRTMAEIHSRALDARGRVLKGPLPTTVAEIHAIALGRRGGHR